MEWLIVIGLVIITIICIFLAGKNSGKDATTTKIQAEVLDNVKKAKQITEDIASLSDDDIRDKLLKRNK
jgi:uncharacterized protein (UPF0333 family)